MSNEGCLEGGIHTIISSLHCAYTSVFGLEDVELQQEMQEGLYLIVANQAGDPLSMLSK